MSFSTILLHLDDDARADLRLDFAAMLAQRFSSHLTGLSCHRPTPYRDSRTAGILGVDPLSLELSHALQLARQRERNFLSRCDQLGLASFDAGVEEDDPGQALVRRALCCDLTILGQPDPDDPDYLQQRQIVEHVALYNAHPALLIPHSGQFDAIGDSVLVGWDGSHEGARALSDSLPLLRAARAVHVVEFDRSFGESGPIDQSRVEPVRRWLSRHEVPVHGSVRFTRADIGNALLSQAADVGADLIVMGAWGHARWKERLLGGTTRTVLDTMTVPVFMSH